VVLRVKEQAVGNKTYRRGLTCTQDYAH
jgi:hypothetical protein